jgi:hypothetical protein
VLLGNRLLDNPPHPHAQRLTTNQQGSIMKGCCLYGRARASGSPANNPPVPADEEIATLYRRVYG